MREILFRGKTTSGRWAEGSLIRAGSYCCILEDEDKVHPADYPFLDNALGYIDGRATPVDPETIGQFTGLLDKNGKKIFEGDVLDYRSPVGCRVERIYISYFGGCFTYVDTRSFDGNAGTPIDDCEYGIDTDYYEVIGNIHDNPELLKV